MTELPRNIATFRLNGVSKDTDPSDLPPDTWSDCRNMVPSEGPYMERVGGSVQRLATPAGEASFLSSAFDPNSGNAYWFYPASTGFFRQSGAGETNMAYPGYTTYTADTRPISEFCGGILNGWPWFSNNADPPAYWDFTGNAKAHTGWPVNQTCGAMWAFKFHLFCGDIDDGTNYQPSQVQWTDATPPRTAPNWTTGATSEAGSAELAEVRGRIQNGGALRNVCAIYAQNVTYLARYIGGAFVFAFDVFSRQMGLLARHGFVEVEGRHFVLTDSDIVVHDGVQIQSIADGTVRRYFLNQVNTDELKRCFAVWFERRREVWFCAPTGTSAVCTLAAVYDLTSGKWGLRDLGESGSAQGLKYARGGILLDAAAPTWTTVTGTWAAQTGTWNSDVSIADADRLVALDRQAAGAGNTILTEIAVTDTTADDQTITGTLERSGLDLGKPDTVKTIRAVHIHARGAGNIEVRVGGQLTESDPITWSSWRSVDLSEAEKASVFATGRLLAVGVRTTIPVEVAGFTLEGSEHGRN